jgi:hypothetical protein
MITEQKKRLLKARAKAVGFYRGIEGSGSLSTLLFLLLGCPAHDIKVAISAWFSVEAQERS